MDFRLTIFFCIVLVIAVSALPSEREESYVRERRDVMESMKNAWSEVVNTLSHASDAVVHVFRPTEKSTIDQIVDTVKGN